MFVVVVQFDVRPEFVESFRAAVLAQAENSLTLEQACRVFDVAVPADRETTFVLYEIYDDEAAFQHHLKTEHFLAFDANMQTMVVSKEVKSYGLISQFRTG
ncbi:MAG: putative quinol monooxygenase [Hyphomicrobiaceae bacterium]